MATEMQDQVKDLLSLGMPEVPVEELVEQIDLCVEHPELQGPEQLPPRTVQLAGLLLSQAIRLIRTGTRSEVADASVVISQFLITPRGEGLSELDPEAYHLTRAASSALGAAAPASSAAGEHMVLRSWDGDGAKLLRCVVDAPGKAIPIHDLLNESGIPEPRVWGPICDLESAGLIVRYRGERNVVVVQAMRKAEAPSVLAMLDLA